jgi:DNA-directed RNA polymerase II subunit RPB2
LDIVGCNFFTFSENGSWCNRANEDDYQDDEITQMDCWAVITAFFDEKGLVGQQRESFDEFIHNTVQEIVDNDSTVVHQTQVQGNGIEEEVTKQYTISFGQIYLSKAMMTESDGSTNTLFPHEARLRNLTYDVPLYVDMKKSIKVADPNHPSNLGVTDLQDMTWEIEEVDDQYQKVFLGRVPLMVRSTCCHLYDVKDAELVAMGECPYDQVLIFYLGRLFYYQRF